MSHFLHPLLLLRSEAARPQGGASRIGNFVQIVPLNPAYKEGLAGRVPAKSLGGW